MLSNITKTVTINDKDYVFNRLTINDQFALVDAIANDREKETRQIGQSEGLSKLEITDLIFRIRALKPTLQDLFQSCNDPRGAVRICKLSLLKAGTADETVQDEVINNMSPGEVLELSRMLVLGEVEAKPEAKSEDKDEKKAKSEAKKK